MCILCYVYLSIATPGRLDMPELTSVTDSSVKVSYKTPENIDNSKRIEYMVNYRKGGDNEWQSTLVTSRMSQIVTGLDKNSLYEVTVAARYKGGYWGKESHPIAIRTLKSAIGECCLVYALLKL